jgi:pimeloyl-ACP methyl ester carboxylesterase
LKNGDGLSLPDPTVTEREIGLDRYGTAGGPLVIALHGAVANGKTWLPLARLLAPGLELWCPDLPGHGARRCEPFRLAAAVESVVTLIGAAGARRVVLAGDSLGGYIALAAAAREPARLVGVVAGGCTWSMTGLGGTLARASDLPPRLVAALLGEARLERFAASQLARLTDAETAAAVAARGLRLRSRSESLSELAGLDLIPLVRAIHVPIAFINGAWDWPTRAGEKSLVHAAETATCTIVPRKGHGVGFFAPAAFARVIETLAVGSCAADT